MTKRARIETPLSNARLRLIDTIYLAARTHQLKHHKLARYRDGAAANSLSVALAILISVAGCS